ncbi:huntingtin-interacting protein M [Lycaon pictus]|nr:huntingtin-interacting protein M [Canis lupus familiaris]XP_025295729.1 huntingtin-interacting protein M [Canis lupus dingo]XP_038305692.1 huntingtin-interacting protein M [Canis lupus familiaris]XP_038443100.1 huntingtin-interacting protein M [Canis lupus familiaris]|eukprot:XP_005641297.1 huntingtin-interacting protein M [Canis lupus familiaris]
MEPNPANIMSGNKNHESSNQTQAHLVTTELQFPVSYVDRLLQEDQRTHCLSSTSTEFLLAMLDSLTDYILERVGTEANNNNMQTAPQDVERAVGSNREPQQCLKDTAFTLFDEMPRSRRNG